MSLTIRQLADQFYSFMEGRKRPRTIAYYRVFLERWINAVGNLAAADVRKHHLLTWGRTWHELQAVQRLFNWAAVEMELIDNNPFAKVRRPRPGRRHRILQRREIVRLLRASWPDFRAFLRCMLETLARPQEVRALHWHELRWDDSVMTRLAALQSGAAWFELVEYKARERRADPDSPRRLFISPRLGRLLVRMLAAHPNAAGFVFLNSLGRPWTSNAVRLRVRRARPRAMLAPDARGENVVAYTCRHTAATNACINGIPDRVLAELMGHTSTRTTARYQHLNVEHLRAAWLGFNKRRIENKSGGKGTA